MANDPAFRAPDEGLAVVSARPPSGGHKRSPADQVYDGFISYSHAADDLLAPRLQSALQRFAKPWWKRRAVRIFRDESSLSANPHLWSSITEALDTSGWFVLLLSPDAAASEWVNQEIAYWVEHRDPKKILPVVTDGEFGWADGDVAGNAAPEALRGVFSEEPRWVDLRGVDTETELDLQNPEFAAAVADIASSIRGIPKDELASEEVRQHRRTVRTAWAAGIVTASLAIAAAGFGFQSARNADLADQRAGEVEQTNEVLAETNTELQQTNTALAEQTREANDQRDLAQQNAQLARARELATAAINATEDDPQLALLLAAEALEAFPAGAEPGADLENAVRTAMASDRLVASRSYELGVGGLDVAPDGRTVAITALRGGAVEMLDAVTLEPVWSYSEDTRDLFELVSFSSSGRFLVVSVQDERISYFAEFLEGEPDGEPDARLLVFDAADGSLVKELTLDGACGANVNDGAMNDVVGILGFGFVGCGPEEEFGTFRFVDTSDWTILHEAGGADFPQVSIAPDGKRAAFYSGFNSEPLSGVLDVETWEVLYDTQYRWGWYSADGESLAGLRYRYDIGGFWVEIVAAESGELSDRLAVPVAPWVSSFDEDGGGRIVVGSYADTAVFFDTVNGEQLLEVPVGWITDLDLKGDQLFHASLDAVNVWRVGPPGGDIVSVPLGFWVNSNSIIRAGDTVVALAADRAVNEWWVLGVNPETGLLDEQIPFRFPGNEGFAPISGGRIVLFHSGIEGIPTFAPDDDVAEVGPLEVMDLATGETTTIRGCWLPGAEAFAGAPCPDGSPHPGGTFAPSHDGSEFGIVRERDSDDEPWRISIWDVDTLAVVEELEIDNPTGRAREGSDGALVMPNHVLFNVVGATIVHDRRSGQTTVVEADEFSPRRADPTRDGTRVWFSSEVGGLWVLDLDTLELDRVTEGQGTEVRGVAPSLDGGQIAMAGADGLVRIYSNSGELQHLIPAYNPSDVYWIDSETLAIATAGGPWGIATLDFGRLEQALVERLRRGFTGEECEFYRIDPCPTLEEIQSR